MLGPGGVGGLVAGALDRAGTPVLVVARDSTVAAISAHGLRVGSVLLGDFVAHPRAVGKLDEPADALIVATKAAGLSEALERVAVAPKLVLPLLNGLDHVALLRERFAPETVVAGTIRVEADRPEPGVVVHTSKFLRVEMASRYAGGAAGAGAGASAGLGASTGAGASAGVGAGASAGVGASAGASAGVGIGEAMAALARTLSDAGIPARVGDSEPQVLWSKLVRLNALACTTSAYDLPLGPIRSTPELRADLLAAIEEGCAVAEAEGASIPSGDPLGELTAAHDTLGSSMQRDIAAGRPPELDAIPGAVLRAAARHGIECPTIERLVARIVGRIA